MKQVHQLTRPVDAIISHLVLGGSADAHQRALPLTHDAVDAA